ncbi:MAG: phosphomannomutase [Desulfobacteraceae bacterium 4572_19]|nr:MAG: phosphomannomutase [Desulfobacteraceae bacterium 4572_19]
MNSEIFREYDIRGIAGVDLTEKDVVLIGKGIGTYLIEKGSNSVSVGRDCRKTSKLYSQKVIEGILSTGCNVIDINICPSPVLYFSIHYLETMGGVMVTASHNPAEYNGFKICKENDSIHGDGLQAIYNIISKNAFIKGKGTLSNTDINQPYLDFIYTKINITKPLRIGVDAGNGVSGPLIIPLLKKLGCETYELYCDMDGTFPNHPADPTVEKNMKDLMDLVKKEKLDLGLGFDGDGDRIGVVDENGRLLYGDQLMIIFSREILSRKPGATFISEVKCSKTMYDDIEKHGGRAIMWKTGHSLIKKKMKEEKAELAGEMSGHMFFADQYLGFDDATYAACRLLEILSQTNKNVSELLSDIPKTFSTPEIRVECPDDKKFDIVKRVTAYFKERYNVIDIDGVRVLFDDGWGLVRASNTQPVLVLRFEAMSEKRLEEIRNLIESNLNRIKNE